jgi:hypothetical protein
MHSRPHLVSGAYVNKFTEPSAQLLRIVLSKGSARLGAFIYLKTEANPTSET